MKLSICIPVFNAQASIINLVEKIREELNQYSLEFILVNDASVDKSDQCCTALYQRYPDEIIYILLRKNYGEHNAVMCCLNQMSGDYAIIIDDDFQNPPSEIIALLDEARKGYDVVYSRYANKNHHPFRNLGSRFNDIIATWLLEKPRGLYLSSFKILHADVVKEIIKYTGPFPYIDGLIFRITRQISSVSVRHDRRSEGKSNYTVKKLVSLWLNMFINFSVKPLRLFTLMGLATASFSALMVIWVIVDKFMHPEINYGWTSIISAISFFSGLQLCFLGTIAEYIGKEYLTINKTPQWAIRRIMKSDA